MPWNAYDTHRTYSEDVANGAVAGTLKAMLVTAVYVPDVNLDEFISDVGSEVAGSSYVAGGNAMTGYLVTMSAAGLLAVDANDPAAWLQDAAGFVNARRCVLYWDTGTPATSRLFAYSDDFGADKGNVSGPFSIAMDALGIFQQAR